jgi:hypothetical protein
MVVLAGLATGCSRHPNIYFGPAPTGRGEGAGPWPSSKIPSGRGQGRGLDCTTLHPVAGRAGLGAIRIWGSPRLGVGMG